MQGSEDVRHFGKSQDSAYITDHSIHNARNDTIPH